MERVGGRQEKMEGHCSTVQSPQWTVVPMEEEEEEEEEEEDCPRQSLVRFQLVSVDFSLT